MGGGRHAPTSLLIPCALHSQRMYRDELSANGFMFDDERGLQTCAGACALFCIMLAVCDSVGAGMARMVHLSFVFTTPTVSFAIERNSQRLSCVPNADLRTVASRPRQARRLEINPSDHISEPTRRGTTQLRDLGADPEADCDRCWSPGERGPNWPRSADWGRATLGRSRPPRARSWTTRDASGTQLMRRSSWQSAENPTGR